MRKYVHFLGYSDSEGGIQEIFESSNFDLGEIDLETMERNFDGFDFVLPEISILKYFPIFDNAPYQLKSNITKNDIDMFLVGSSALSVNDLLWIENERIKILQVLSTDYYRVERGVNNSIPIKRLYSEFIPEIQTTICQKQRIMPVGLIVKVYDGNNLTLAYGQIDTVEIMTNGAFRVVCKNLLSQLENSFVSNLGSMRVPYAKGLEIFELFDIPSELSDVIVFGKTIENYPNYSVFEDFLKVLYQMCVFTNQIITFDKFLGRYTFKYLGRIKNGQTPISVKLLDYININGGSVKVEMTPRYFCATLKMNVNGEENTFTVVDYQFQSGFMGSKKIEIEKDDTLELNMDHISIQHQIRKKLFFLNSSYEKLTLSGNKLSPFFIVGDYYKLLDIQKIKMFTDATKNNIFLCVKNSDGEVSLLRQESYEVAQVAPAIPIVKTSTAKVYQCTIPTLEYNNTNFSIGDFLKTNYSGDGYLYNVYTDSVMFDVGDIVKIIESDGNVTANEITSVGIDGNGYPLFTFDTEITTTTGKVLIMTIREGYNLTAKNNVYLYENNGRI